MKPQFYFSGFSRNRISVTALQVTRRPVCRQIRNSAPFFVTPHRIIRTMAQVLVALLCCAGSLQTVWNLQISAISDFPQAPPT